MKWSAKRVESSGVPCLDAGSTPATSTLSLRLMSQAFLLYIRILRIGIPTRSNENSTNNILVGFLAVNGIVLHKFLVVIDPCITISEFMYTVVYSLS